MIVDCMSFKLLHPLYNHVCVNRRFVMAVEQFGDGTTVQHDKCRIILVTGVEYIVCHQIMDVATWVNGVERP